MYIYLNDKIVHSTEARISVFDHGFLYGDGIFETIRVYDGVAFMLDEHLKRLFRSASLIGLNIQKTFSEIKIAIYETLQANSLTNAYLRITVTRGEGAIGLDPALCKGPTFVIMVNEFKEYPSSYYKNGLKAIISTVKRNIKEAIDSRIKSLNFLNNILAKIEAKQHESYEAIMLNYQDYLAEGTISNIFFVKNDILCTPSIECGILDGITRAIVIDLAIKNGIRVKEGEFTRDDLFSASEVFITNTTMEVMPVSVIIDCRSQVLDPHVNKPRVIHYSVGDISKMLLSKYRKEVIGYVREKKGETTLLWQ